MAQTLTILRWRGSSEPADISTQALAVQVRNGLIARLELLTSLASPPASSAAIGDGGQADEAQGPSAR